LTRKIEIVGELSTTRQQSRIFIAR
jgi:hypothetical protein